MCGSRFCCETLEICCMNWVSKSAARLAIREQRSAPTLARIDDCFVHHRARASAKSPLGEALAYIAKYRDVPLLDRELAFLRLVRPSAPNTFVSVV